MLTDSRSVPLAFAFGSRYTFLSDNESQLIGMLVVLTTFCRCIILVFRQRVRSDDSEYW